MKKMIFAAVLFCGAVVNNVNAEEMNSPEQVVNPEVEALAAPEVAADTTIVVYMVNQGEVEYSPEVRAGRANYARIANKKGLRTFKVETYIGNDVEATPLVEENREGLQVALIGQYSRFDEHNCFGGGLELAYFRQYVGFSIAGTLSNGYEARSSERHKSFTQLDAMARYYSPKLELKIGKDVLWFSFYGEVSFKKRKDLKSEKSSSIYVNDIEVEGDPGTEITTVVRTSKLDARPHVFGWAVGARAQYDIWMTPISFFASIDWGKSQNFNYLEKQWLPQTKVQVGLSIRLNRSRTYTPSISTRNTYLYEDLGYSRQEVLSRKNVR